MTAGDAFTSFVRRTLASDHAERLTALCASKRGQRKILEWLCHRFADAVRADARASGGYDRIWESPCYVFFQPFGFGAEFATVRAAYVRLSWEDGWLILLQDASVGIHRPEARWDEEALIAGPGR